MTGRGIADTRPNQETSRVDQLGLLGAVSRHSSLVLAILAVFALLGYVLIQTQPTLYAAEAGLIVEDARATSEFTATEEPTTRSNQASERYLADQVEILSSTQVAQIASGFLADSGIDRSPEELLRNRTVEGAATNNLITVTFQAASPETAKAGADALVDGYVELRRRLVQESSAGALEEVDALQAALEEELDVIEGEIAELRESDEARRTLQAQFDEALATLNSLRQERQELPVGSAEREAINAQIEELRQDFAAWEIVMGIEQQSSQATALVARRDATIAEIATLANRKNAIAVDAELEGGGVVLSDPAALPQEPSGIPPAVIMVAALALGTGVATAAAYQLEVRRAGAASRSTPEAILNAPLLAEVPGFRHERITTEVPVRSAPTSAAAEAFRFAAAALDVRASAVGARSVLVTSASVGAGKTVALANTGIAAASEGLRILLVDADFGAQELTALFGEKPAFGLTELATGAVGLDDAITTIEVSNNRSLALLSRGWERVEAPTFMRSEQIRTLFEQLKSRFDLVLIDGPPLLQVAYTSTLANLADSTVVVVEHAAPTSLVEEVADRLELIDAPVLGYIYTKAPLRPEMTVSEGSTADILGTARGGKEPASAGSGRRSR